MYESDGFVGGQASEFEVEPVVWLERFYHHVFRSDRILRRTYDELGLAGGLSWTHPLTATLLGGKIEQLDSPTSLLRFRGLPLAARLRMGVTLAALRLLPRPGLLEGRAAAPRLRRWLVGGLAGTGWARHARAGGQRMTARHDGVISTLPPRVTGFLASELPDSWRAR